MARNYPANRPKHENNLPGMQPQSHQGYAAVPVSLSRIWLGGVALPSLRLAGRGGGRMTKAPETIWAAEMAVRLSEMQAERDAAIARAEKAEAELARYLKSRDPFETT